MKTLRFKKTRNAFAAMALSLSGIGCFAQNDAMMQAFYWDLPADETAKNGYWWDSLKDKAESLKTAGITAIWIPSPCKGNFGIYDMGYALYDHYDLGNYNQKGSVETRFGSKQELKNMVDAMHGGTQRINVYADIVLNHIYGGDDNFEVNPAVKDYTFGEAHGWANEPYPASEIKWTIPNATPGDYYIQIKGYKINDVPEFREGYEARFEWNNATSNNYTWESEPNNGAGQFNTVPSAGYTMRGLYDGTGSIDEYKVTVTSTSTISITISARAERISNNAWEYPGHPDGYYPVAVWFNGSNLASSRLQAQTRSNITYPNHSGDDEANISWNYTNFHPVNSTDWLGDGGFEDQIVTNTKWFGNDINTFDPLLTQKLNDWGTWLTNKVGFDGYRLDFVRGFQESVSAGWVSSLPKQNGQQRFIVGEYWTEQAYRLKNWVTANAAKGANVSVFDFPGRTNLQRLCNGDENSYQISWLNHGNMYRATGGNNLPADNIVQFIDNHDTGKESDKWIRKDFGMAYAYMFTHPGRPCVFYPHYYAITQHDHTNPSVTVTAPASLQGEIDRLMFIRKTYLNGHVEVLSEVGNPYPANDVRYVYVARRAGNGTKDGAIVVLNNSNNTTRGLWVNVNASGFSNWTGQTLVNAMNPSETLTVYGDGRAYFSAPSRGYKIFVKQSDYKAYIKSAIETIEMSGIENSINIYPTVTSGAINLKLTLSKADKVNISITNMQGKTVKEIENKTYSSGNVNIASDLSQLDKGIYLCKVAIGSQIKTEKIIIQ